VQGLTIARALCSRAHVKETPARTKQPTPTSACATATCRRPLLAASRAAPPAIAALKSVLAAALPAARAPEFLRNPATLLLSKKASL
jgi:hypothetical protein